MSERRPLTGWEEAQQGSTGLSQADGHPVYGPTVEFAK